MEGWIKLHRKLLEWEWFSNQKILQIFIYILLKANHEEKQWHGTTIKRGELVTSLKSISNSTGLSIRSIRTCLKQLKSTHELTSKATNRYTLISITNYDYWQSKEYGDMQNGTLSDKQTTNKRQTNDNKQELKNYKNEKKGKKKESIKEKTFIPPTPKEVTDYCREKGYLVDGKMFVEYYSVDGWKDANGKPVKSWKKKALVVWCKTPLPGGTGRDQEVILAKNPKYHGDEILLAEKHKLHDKSHDR